MATTSILLDTFPGLSLPSTVTFSLASTSTTSDLLDHISSLLPPNLSSNTRLILTTTSNKQIFRSDAVTLASLISPTRWSPAQNAPPPSPPLCPSTLLPLRLSIPYCGGKGGFGSQLRAAGGRMSSRKKKNNETQTGSNRNLDGRRLRTITEAKNLATYLAIKPEMDRREKEERRKRWEMVVEAAERREAEIRSGKKGKGLSEEWVEEKEDISENVKNAVQKAMTAAQQERKTVATMAESSGSGGSQEASEASDNESDSDMMELGDSEMARLQAEAEDGDVDAIWVLKNQVRVEPRGNKKPQERRFAGFDDDDEYESSSSEEDEKEVKGKRTKIR